MQTSETRTKSKQRPSYCLYDGVGRQQTHL